MQEETRRHGQAMLRAHHFQGDDAAGRILADLLEEEGYPRPADMAWLRDVPFRIPDDPEQRFQRETAMVRIVSWLWHDWEDWVSLVDRELPDL